MSICPKIQHTKSSNQNIRTKVTESFSQTSSERNEGSSSKNEVIVKPSLHLPNKSPLGEVRIRHEIFNSDLTLASASKTSHRGEQTKKLNNLLKIAQWNLRSLSYLYKIQTINSIDCEILALQEINHLNEDAIEKIHTKSVMMKKERSHDP